MTGEYARIASLPGTGLIGLATSKKIGSHPARNRVKRRWREALQANRDRQRPDLDLIVIAASKSAEATLPQLLAAAAAMLDKTNARWANASECS